jgi:drug/metabolite transporter (DMT)-like permease
MLSSRHLGTLTLVLITLIWGSTFVIVKETVASVPPALLLALRFSVAALLFAWVRPSRAALLPGLVLGVLSFAGFATQTLGLVSTTASKAAFITGLSVILTPLFSALWFRYRGFRYRGFRYRGFRYRGFRHSVSARAYLAAAVALAGLALMSFSGPLGVTSGDLWVLGTAVFYAFYIIYLGEVAPKHGALELSAVQFWPMAALAWLWAVPQLGQSDSLSSGSLWSLLYLGAVATALVSVLQVRAQRVVSAHVAALIFVLEPVFAALFAYVLLGETLGVWGWVGAGLVGAAMLLSELKMSREGEGLEAAPPTPH